MKPNSLGLFIVIFLCFSFTKAQDTKNAVNKRLYGRLFVGIGVNSYRVNPGMLSLDFPITVYNSQNNTTYPQTLNPSASFSTRKYAWEIPFGLEFIYRKYTANISLGIGFGKYGPLDFSLGLERNISISKKISINTGFDYFHIEESYFFGSLPQSGMDVTINGKTYYHQFHGYNSGVNYNATYLTFDYYQAIGGFRPKVSLLFALSEKAVVKLNVGYSFPVLYDKIRLEIDQVGNTAHPQNLYPNVEGFTNNNLKKQSFFNYSFTGSSQGAFYSKGIVANIEIGYTLKKGKKKKRHLSM